MADEKLVAASLANLKLERDAIVLYDRLAHIEKDPARAAAFRTIASNERRHADIWASKLRDSGALVPDADRPRARIRVIVTLARLFGTRAVSDLVKSLEGDEEDVYAEQEATPEIAAIAADEREHAEIWKRLDFNMPYPQSARTDGAPATVGFDAPAVAAVAALPGEMPAGSPASHAREETWHRAGRTGTLRAAIFGVSDGLMSNLALVMGVAGANPDNHVIVLAGIAGLLAGAFSMGAGEWISMTSQRELFERQIALEREEMRLMPRQEEAELARIYRRKGLPDADARKLAARLMADPQVALDTKVREELGLDPAELGSAWGAASGSFVAFAVGALVPLAPFVITSGGPARIAALLLALIALFVVGAGVSLLTGRGIVFSGLRQVLIGAATTAVTFAIGTLVGTQVGG